MKEPEVLKCSFRGFSQQKYVIPAKMYKEKKASWDEDPTPAQIFNRSATRLDGSAAVNLPKSHNSKKSN